MEQLSRRNFLALGGAGVAVVGAAAAMTEGSASAEEVEEMAVDEIVDDQLELPIPEGEKPEATEYETDVLVVGCGFAGLSAAAAVADSGANVLVVEKGTPGYGGLSPYAGRSAYYRDDADWDKTIQWDSQSNEYLLNQKWVKTWTEDSPAHRDRMYEWGFFQDYTLPIDTPYYVDGYFDGTPGHDDHRGYFQSEEVWNNNRHPRTLDVLASKGIEHVDHTMVVDVLESDGRVVGAVALHVPSGEIIRFKAKAVILCCGSGAVSCSGYPLSADAFDGAYICYKHGIPITGYEFEDYRLSYAGKPGLLLTCSGWDYSQPLDPDPMDKYADATDDDLWASTYITKTNYDACIEGITTPESVASTYKRTPSTEWSSPGAAIGYTVHMSSGAFCGWDDDLGATSLPGLYVAGDGCNGSYIAGACNYGIGLHGSSASAVQGYRAGTAAAEYASDHELADLPADQVADLTEEILAPLEREKGYSPIWVEDQLANIIGMQPVIFRKSEDILNSALVQVEFIRDNYLPMLRADSTHDLRICRDAIQKTTICEAKLRLGLARKESRGFHYRTDYPYRDDQYLGAFTATKTDNSMEINFVEEPDEWKGDLTADYATRYSGSYRFPGEAEALGIDFPESTNTAPRWSH